eukprot:564783-Pleurochrysis_carterae.AAC.2
MEGDAANADTAKAAPSDGRGTRPPARGGPKGTVQAEATAVGATQAAAAEPGPAAATGEEGGWRADVSAFVASALRARGTRAAGAVGVASRAAMLGLAGPLGMEAADRWRDGDPSSPAARNMQALRTAARARVMEVTDARRTGTALSWFSDFAESTERVPFLDPLSPGGAAYKLETLVLLVEFIRRGGSRHVS